ncbi:hemerythrin domain-containing protein [Thiorhodococcus minor]|nr:hemerythrin domain-containing protein [Thiorhodococcus minor]
MPKSTTWRQEWSLGVPALDAEHCALLAQLDQIARRYSPDTSADRKDAEPALICALTDLGEAVRSHFRRTTERMAAIGYDGIERCHAENALLMAEYAELLRAWRSQRQHVLDETMHRVLREWLLAHIFGVDRAFVDAYVTASCPLGRRAEEPSRPQLHRLERSRGESRESDWFPRGSECVEEDRDEKAGQGG